MSNGAGVRFCWPVPQFGARRSRRRISSTPQPAEVLGVQAAQSTRNPRTGMSILRLGLGWMPAWVGRISNRRFDTPTGMQARRAWFGRIRSTFWSDSDSETDWTLLELVRPVGFEPTAFCSGGKRSIQTELRAHDTQTLISLSPLAGRSRTDLPQSATQVRRQDYNTSAKPRFRWRKNSPPSTNVPIE